MSTYTGPPVRNSDNCCEGLRIHTPAAIDNRPGLAAIAYRVGTHARFKRSMLARLSAAEFPALHNLNTREDTDASVALLDAWAAVADVLAFYQERIANESYLRTATERLSLLHLARLIGYELRPGVAAGVDLAFALEDAPPVPGQPDVPSRVTVEAGTRVQSIPGPGERPQTFETVEGIEARPEWNALRPRRERPQALSNSTLSVTVQELSVDLQPGDGVLLVAGSGEANRLLKTVAHTVPDPGTRTTRVEFEAGVGPPAWKRPELIPAAREKLSTERIPLTQEVVRQYILDTSWKEEDLRAVAAAQGWELATLEANIRAQLGDRAASTKNGAYAFRHRAALFGHNAPRWSALPSVQRKGEWFSKLGPDAVQKMVLEQDGAKATAASSSGQFQAAASQATSQPKQGASNGNKTDGLAAVFSGDLANAFEFLLPAYPVDWEKKLTLSDAVATRQVYLDNTYPGVVERSWLVLRTPDATRSYRVESNVETTRTDYALTAKVSRLTLEKDQDLNPLKNFKLRETTALMQSERLSLAHLPITENVEGDEVMLDGPYFGLGAGRRVIVSGERADLLGVTATEAVTLAGVRVEDGHTLLTFREPLVHGYVREKVTLNANVAPATHGESAEEVLGGGDGAEPYQGFTLRRSPLTHTSAPTPSGARSTLRVRVNDLLWDEVPSLYGRGPDERVYTTRLDDEGNTAVRFGDGRAGARPPTGQENVRAAYRVGIGAEGLVEAGRQSLLMTRPLGVRSVTNPLPATGAADRETRDEARRNAPLTVLTLDRIVSLQDYEDFARSYGGIAKALATWTWDGQRRGVLVTVSGTGGAKVAPGDTLYKNLLAAMRKAGDPYVYPRLNTYSQRSFRLEAGVGIRPDHLPESVLPEVRRRLRESFGFDAREFGQGVALSEVAGVAGATPGVTAVDVDVLHRGDREESLQPYLDAAVPRAGDTEVLAAELLTLDPQSLKIEEMT